MVGTSLWIRIGFGKETMQRKENISGRYGRKERQKHVRNRIIMRKGVMCLLLSAVIAVCCGCTKKEQLVFSAENDTSSNEEENLSGEASQFGGSDTAAKSGETVQNATDSGNTLPESSEEGGFGLNQDIYVHVCGAVVHPGVYELPAGSRVYEAIQAAGGFTEEADADYVNQALQLSDASQIVIPTMEEAAALGQPGGQNGITGGVIGTSEVQESSGDGGKININIASESQLCDIPGIGAVRAAAIAAYRQEHGAFETIEDIMKVSGIKQGTYDKIKDSITVN